MGFGIIDDDQNLIPEEVPPSIMNPIKEESKTVTDSTGNKSSTFREDRCSFGMGEAGPV